MNTVSAEQMKEMRKRRQGRTQKFALITSVLIPGIGPLFLNQPLLSVVFQMNFWVFLQMSRGGWLTNDALIQGPGTPAFGFLRWTAAAIVLFWYLLALTLVIQHREDIEPS